LSNCGKGLPRPRSPYYGFLLAAALARQAQPKGWFNRKEAT